MKKIKCIGTGTFANRIIISGLPLGSECFAVTSAPHEVSIWYFEGEGPLAQRCFLIANRDCPIDETNVKYIGSSEITTRTRPDTLHVFEIERMDDYPFDTLPLPAENDPRF